MSEPIEDVTVTVTDSGLKRLPDVVERLRAAGLRVDDVLASVGAVTGRASAAALSDLAGVDGVDSVERVSGGFAVPDPESDIQ